MNTLVNFRPAQTSKTDQFSAGANSPKDLSQICRKIFLPKPKIPVFSQIVPNLESPILITKAEAVTVDSNLIISAGYAGLTLTTAATLQTLVNSAPGSTQKLDQRPADEL